MATAIGSTSSGPGTLVRAFKTLADNVADLPSKSDRGVVYGTATTEARTVKDNT
jgi:hypothetical protein